MSARRGCRAVTAAVTLLVLGFQAAPARAFCREVTQKAPSAYDPGTMGCFKGDGGSPSLPVFWRNQCVGYSLQMGASAKVPLTVARSIARQAFDTWTTGPAAWCAGGGGPPSIQVVEFPPVSCDQVVLPPSPQYNNPIIFHDSDWPYTDSANALGYTTVSFVQATGEIVATTIEINSSHPIVYGLDGADGGKIPSGSYDLESILTHEVGHFLGLAHSQDPGAIMYAFYNPGSTSLQTDDVAGICSIYPANQTRATAAGSVPAGSCNPEPPNGFSRGCVPETDAGASGGAAGADAGDPSLCTDALLSCSLDRAPRTAGKGFALAGLVGLALLARRRRYAMQALARRRTQGLAAAGVLGVLGILAGPPARASVSIAAGFEELVQKASAVAVVTPVEARAAWEGGRIVTYTRVRIDRLVAGGVDEPAWVRTMGGLLDGLGQSVEGEATFSGRETSLVFLRARPPLGSGGPAPTFAVVEGAQGQFALSAGVDGKPRLAPSRGMGAVVSPAREGGASRARLARDVLGDRLLEDAVRAIAESWKRLR